MKKVFRTRTMLDETIVGGPFVRYIPEPGTLYMITEKTGSVERVVAFCLRMACFDWVCFTVGAFRKCGSDETATYWAEPIHEEIIVTDDMTAYQVPIEDWMKTHRWIS
jgi:hypothetical protein